MLKKRSLPPKNPLSRETDPGTLRNNKNNIIISQVENGGSKGERERVKPAEALLICGQCAKLQKIVFEYGNPPNWHKCAGCNALQPVDGYRMLVYGLGLPDACRS